MMYTTKKKMSCTSHNMKFLPLSNKKISRPNHSTSHRKGKGHGGNGQGGEYFMSYCLSLYGACLWRPSWRSSHTHEVTFNKFLRKMWLLAFNTHTCILHCIAELESLYTVVQWRLKCFMNHALSSSNKTCQCHFLRSCWFCYTITWVDTMFGETFGKQYSDQDWLHVCADVIHHFRCRRHFLQLLMSERLQISEMLNTIATA